MPRALGRIVRRDPRIPHNLARPKAHVVPARDLHGLLGALSVSSLPVGGAEEEPMLLLRQREQLCYAAAHRLAYAVDVQRACKVKQVLPPSTPGARRHDRGGIGAIRDLHDAAAHAVGLPQAPLVSPDDARPQQQAECCRSVLQALGEVASIQGTVDRVG